MINQLDMFQDFEVVDPNVKPEPQPWDSEPDFNSFILKMYPYHTHELWFRDFLGYCITPNRLVKDVHYVSLDRGTTYEDQEYLCSFAWHDLLEGEQHGYYQRDLNVIKQERKAPIWNQIIEELQLSLSLEEIYAMTVREFYYYIKLNCREEAITNA